MKDKQLSPRNMNVIRLLCADCGESFPQASEQSSLCPRCDEKILTSSDKWREKSGEKE
jgi:DNA-directed RNA polymerase subunit RPC12/RpoP